MKRSEINQIIQAGVRFIESRSFLLPPFASWTPQDWQQKGPECLEIVETGLGWDITDFGSGDFTRIGLLAFTIRNGKFQNVSEGAAKSYAEKIMIVQEDQVTPTHFHFHKMEDIINRGGGKLAIQLWNSTETDQLADSEVQVVCDGVGRRVPAGTTLVFEPGESITLPPRLYHRFWGQKGLGPVLVGEVSKVNDDFSDNRFFDPVGRFPEIEEDELPFRLLCGDYKKYYSCA
jgi:D-lyxose ketol-isomerase